MGIFLNYIFWIDKNEKKTLPFFHTIQSQEENNLQITCLYRRLEFNLETL